MLFALKMMKFYSVFCCKICFILHSRTKAVPWAPPPVTTCIHTHLIGGDEDRDHYCEMIVIREKRKIEAVCRFQTFPQSKTNCRWLVQ